MTIIEIRIKIKPDIPMERIKKIGEHVKDYIYGEFEEISETYEEVDPIEDVTYEIRDDYQE